MGQTPLPRCLDMISAADVIRRIELYYMAGRLAEIDSAEAVLG